MARKTTPNRFGAALKKAREDKQIRLYELSEKLDVSVPFLSDVENGRRPLSDPRIRKAASFLGVDAIPLLELSILDKGKIVLDTAQLNPHQLRTAIQMSLGHKA